MKGILAGAAALLLSSSVLAAQVKISEISYNYPKSNENQYRLPWLVIKSNPDVARRINDYIFTHFVPHLPGKDPQATLNRMADGKMGQIASLDFSVVNKNERVLTLDIFAEACGAYCESWDAMMSFDLQTGTRISPTDIIKPEALETLNDLVRSDIRRQITAFINQHKSQARGEQDIDSQDYIDYADFYASCLERTTRGQHYAQGMTLNKGNLVFHNGRCSNHADRALDELGDFTSKIPVADIASHLTPYGKSLFTSKPEQPVTAPPGLEGRLLYGVLGEKTPVVLTVNCDLAHFAGAYFYARYGQAIELSGTCPPTGDEIILTVDGEEGVKETITLALADNTYRGEWRKGEKVLPIEFALP